MQPPIKSDNTTPEKQAAGGDTAEAEQVIVEKNDSDPKGDSKNAKTAANNSKDNPAYYPKRRSRLRKIIRIALRVMPALTGVAMLAVIILQSVIYNGQWRVMQEQLRLQGVALGQAREMQRLSDRAWVAVHSSSLDRIVKPWENGFSTVSFINVGKTPANNLRLEMWTGTGGREIHFRDLPRPTPEGMESQGVLPPASVPAPQHIKTSVPLTETLVKEIEGGFRHVYVYGTIQYDDAAGHHSTDFCFEAREATVKTEYTACIDGNVAR